MVEEYCKGLAVANMCPTTACLEKMPGGVPAFILSNAHAQKSDTASYAEICAEYDIGIDTLDNMQQLICSEKTKHAEFAIKMLREVALNKVLNSEECKEEIARKSWIRFLDEGPYYHDAVQSIISYMDETCAGINHDSSEM